uniref:Uncharacterized protein n=1 Tax=Tetranychus urticae TaxID=32264 RepID=T1K8F4_TETUR
MKVCAEPDSLHLFPIYGTIRLWSIYPIRITATHWLTIRLNLLQKNIPFDAVASPDDFPLINNQHLVITLIIIYLCFIIEIIPSLMSSRLPYNLRPWLVTYFQSKEHPKRRELKRLKRKLKVLNLGFNKHLNTLFTQIFHQFV